MWTEKNGTTLTVILGKNRTENYVSDLTAEISSYKGQGLKKIIFDATELMFLTSEGVSQFVSSCKAISNRIEIVFLNCPQEIQDMLTRVGLRSIIKFETNQERIDSVREKKYHNLKEDAIQKLDEHRHKLLEEFAAKNDVVCYTMKLGEEE
jgi:anti-anti-sigma regulatory factor